MISPTENGELMGKVGTEVSKPPKEPMRAPFPSAWDVPAAESGEGASLLGFLSAISASTLNGRMATLGFPESSAALRLVCMFTPAARAGSSSDFRAAVRADMAVDGAMQVHPVPGKRAVDCDGNRGKTCCWSARHGDRILMFMWANWSAEAVIRQAQR